MTRRLGRGLGSLLGEPFQEEESGRLDLPIDEIRPNPFQPRRTFDPATLEELQRSIERHGVLQPVVVRKAASGYELVSGERRWRAARQAGLSTLPAVLRSEVSDEEMLELSLVENVQREDLDPIERAKGLKALMEKLDLPQQGLADRVGMKRVTVANLLRLLDLPEEVQEAVSRGLLAMGHARALLGLPTGKAMTALCAQIVRKDLSVREVERLVKERSSQASPRAPVREPALEPWAGELQGRMQDYLGTKVTLMDRAGRRGRIVIEYYSRPDLDRLCRILAPRESL